MNDQATPEVVAGGSKRTAPPPIERIPVLRWVRENLVSTPFNAAVTAICLIGLIYFLPGFIEWALFDAVFVTSDHKVCRAAEGACKRSHNSQGSQWRNRLTTAVRFQPTACGHTWTAAAAAAVALAAAAAAVVAVVDIQH